MKYRNAVKKKRRKMILISAVLALAVLFAVSTAVSRLKGGTATIVVREGDGSAQIASVLKDEGVIRSRLWFMVRLAVSEYNGKLQYGTFKIDKNASMNEILETLATKGAKKNTVTLTVPEGYSVEMIKARVAEMGLCTENEFEAALKKDYDYSFLKSVPSSGDIKYRLQGFLYPSTYEFYSDASAETIIDTMLGEFEKQTASLNIPQEKLYETVIKASMVEREARISSERAIIAGVFENRLKQDMLMQIDATVVYAVSGGMYNLERVYYKDLKVNSKYNTYKYKGLPVGPICCPGIASLRAAANPASHNYLYYHTDTAKNDGSHIFTQTYEEHTNTQK